MPLWQRRYECLAENLNCQTHKSSVGDFLRRDLPGTNLSAMEKSEFFTSNDNRCRSPSVYRRDDPIVVDVDICDCPTVHPRRDENLLLENVVVNRGIIHQFAVWYNRQSAIPLSYLIGIPLGWLLLGLLQYFVCVIVLGDILLDPWYFTCTWIVEVISTLPITLFVIVAKCLYVRMEILEYCEKITWLHFTFIIFQGLAIMLLLLPISDLFKYVFGDFSRPINFLIYWTVFAFPHIMVLYFSSFGCCSKMFRAFSGHLRSSNSWNNHEQTKRVHFETTKPQVTLNNDNNIELQELNSHPMLRSSKDLQHSSYKQLNE